VAVTHTTPCALQARALKQMDANIREHKNQTIDCPESLEYAKNYFG
jgi:hypothetical protein